MKGYFVDKIPLIIYWKGVEQKTIDLGGKNSLDLAPSILSLLHSENADNLFLGCTFSEECSLDRISKIGSEYILTDKFRSYSEHYVPEQKKEDFYRDQYEIDRYKKTDLIIGKNEAPSHD